MVICGKIFKQKGVNGDTMMFKKEKKLDFLRTVNFGGFDKKDVLVFVDDLNKKIYELEEELKYTKKKLAEADETISAKNREIDELKRKAREQYYNS